MQDLISAILQSRYQVPLVAFVTVLSVWGTIGELRRSRGFAIAYLHFAFFAACFIIFGWLRGSENPFLDRFNDAFGAFVIMIVPGLMLYVRNAGFIDRIVPLWAYGAIGVTNVACAAVPFTVRFHEATAEDKVANHAVSTAFVCVFISLWVLTQLPFEGSKFKRRLCLLFGLVGYIGALGHLAKYLVWYYALYPFFFFRVFLLISSSRKAVAWFVMGLAAVVVVALVPDLTGLAISNRIRDAYTLSDYIDFKVTRSWLDTDYKVLGLSDGGRVNLWTEYLSAYSEMPLTGLGFGYRSIDGILEHSLPLFLIVRGGIVGWVFLLVYVYYNYRIWNFLVRYHPRIRRLARVTQICFNISMCFTTIYAEVYILFSYYAFIGTMLGREKAA